MKKMLSIDQSMGAKIINTLFMMFAELSGNFFGCLGMNHGEGGQISTLPFEPAGVSLQKEVENYLATAETKRRSGSPILMTATPHSISGFVMEDGSVFCFGSPFGNPYDLAVAVLYGHYHQLKERREIVDEVFEDILLLQLNEWQNKFAHNNEIIVPLAQAIFRPEILKIQKSTPDEVR